MSSSSSRTAARAPLWFLVLTAAALACSEAATGPAGGQPEPSPAGEATGAERTAQGWSDARRPMKFRATVAPVGEVVPPPEPCLQLFNTVIEGHATHLGRFTGTGSTCILEAIVPDPNPPFPAPGPAPYLTASFSNPLWVLTAANGDELWLQAPDAVAVISLADNSLRAAGPHTIIGGTGRFQDATGELDSVGTNANGQGPDDFESRGWIRY